jgi:hypothetical protein
VNAQPPQGWIHQYLEMLGVDDPGTAAQAARDAAYQRHHTPGQSWVVDSVRMIRCEHDQVWVLRDGQLTWITADETRVELMGDRAAYLSAAVEVFGLPRLPMAAGLDALQALSKQRLSRAYSGQHL